VTLLAPGFLLAGVAAALAVLALHFLARQQPPRGWLPTARFVPDRQAHAPARALQPSDLLVLLLRMAAVVLAGLALAQPVTDAVRRPLARIVLLERSRAIANPAEAADSARSLLRGGDVLIAFDTAARRLPAESLAAVPSQARGSLTSALLAAQRAARELAGRADSVELVLVAPLVREGLDAATAELRAAWPAGLRLVPVAAAAPPQGAITVTGAPGDDVIAAAVALMGLGSGVESVRVQRGAVTPADSVFAAAGGALVVWPAVSAAPADTSGAFVVRGVASGDEAVVVATFARGAPPAAGDTLARWADGVPAATERPLGRGCVRDVRIAPPPASDVMLREAARRALAVLAGPCGAPWALDPLPDSLRATLAGSAGALAVARPARAATFPPLSGWLLLVAALLLVAETFARRSRA
jgi:hypothetical protein